MPYLRTLTHRVCHGFHPGLSNEPKNIKIGPEMSEISLKQCSSHISFVSGPILMFLGSLESHGVATGSTRDKPYLPTGEGFLWVGILQPTPATRAGYVTYDLP